MKGAIRTADGRRCTGIVSASGWGARRAVGAAAAAWTTAARATGVGTNSDRLPHDGDSWIALGLVLLSLIVAWSMNSERFATRRAGIVLAGLGCLGVTAWFVAAHASGFVTDPKPAVTALDPLKPGLLWVQAGLFTAAGLFLIVVAARLRDDPARAALSPRNERGRYGLVSRYLHWTTAILFLSLFPIGIFMSMIPEGVWFRQGYYVVHKTIGLLVLALLLIRVAWNVHSARPGFDRSLGRGEARLAHGVHRALYGLLLAFPVTGFVMSTYSGKLSHFFLWDTPLFWAMDRGAVRPWGLAHKIVLPYLAYLIVGAHIAGVLKHHVIDRMPRAIRRMVG